MTLEEKLERLADRTPPDDAAHVLADARARIDAEIHRRGGGPWMLGAVAAALIVVALAAAAFALTRSDADGSVTVAGPTTASTVEENDPAPAGGVDGPVMYAPAAQSDRMEMALVEGRLARNSDCLFVEPGDEIASGLRYVLLWPNGTTWDDDTETVRVPGGVGIPVGSEFTAAGGYYTVEDLGEAGQHPDVIDRASGCAFDSSEVAYVQGDVRVTDVAPELTVPTYDLELPGAELVEDSPHMARNTDVTLWSDGRGAYLSLIARPGLPGTYSTPGTEATVPDDTFPAERGEAWLSEPDDPRFASMWWVHPSGDLWMLRAHWYGDSVPDHAEAALRDWALAIVHNGAANPPYVMSDDSMSIVAFEAAGDKPSRSRVWEYDGHEVTLLVNERSAAAGRSNLLDRGAPAVTDVPALGEVWAVGSTFGWSVPGPSDAWATLTVPDALIGQAEEILEALRLADP